MDFRFLQSPVFWDIALRLSISTLIGAVIGLNRFMHNKPAGLKTHALVALGSTLLVITAIQLQNGFSGTLLPSPGNAEQNAISRVIQGIVQGIGFLGAGVILQRDSGSRVQGLTSAASIWLTAGIGIACGIGFWQLIVVAFVLVLLVVMFGGKIEKKIYRWYQVRSMKNGNNDDARSEPGND